VDRLAGIPRLSKKNKVFFGRVLFNSCQFLIFFLMTTAWFYAVKHRFRWPLLLLFSCYFYMAFVPKYILILFFLILIDYVAGLVIEPAKGFRRKLFLIISLVANIGMLSFFKYFNFAESEAARFFSTFGIPFHRWHLNVILPIGLSFHTFQSMSYTIEVYRGKFRVERHLGLYAVYVLFYPQMVAGPIERPQNLLPQFHAPVTFQSQNIFQGVELMLWGLFKKVVIADNLALIADPVYQNPALHSGWPLVVATYAFAIQIYCDFSGYTDIARGAARTLGYHLMLNFDRPYHSRSIAEFWRRWHISLSTWFRDYLYIPLGGNRVSAGRHYFNIMVVFLLSGLWHGASRSFIVWGGLHGMYIICGSQTYALRQRLWKTTGFGDNTFVRTVVETLVTFHLVWFSWIFFRAGSLRDAKNVLANMAQLAHSGVSALGQLDNFHRTGLVISLLILATAHHIQRACGFRNLTCRLPALARVGIFCGGVVWTLLFGQFTSHDFIYFQF
jgi:D-alanyl-lipoteichoic acid acyltransferase DltB (MBOAT superfamily)